MNFDLDFSTIITLALDDPDADVRRAAVDGVLEDCPPRVIERLMAMAQDDANAEVRAAAAGALGQFILLGELGKLPERLAVRLQDTALALHRNPNEDLNVRRRALEAIANCGREGVPELIREAYYHDNLMMRVSAVFAMGRSCDDVWAPQVLEELSSEYPEMLYEATRAAGELELRKALARLAELAGEEDREIQEMAIWSLGEIGGKAALNILENLAVLAVENEDDDLADAIEEAQSAASFSGEDLFPLFDLADLEDDDDLDEEDKFDDEDLDDDLFDDEEGYGDNGDGTYFYSEADNSTEDRDADDDYHDILF
jgi:HEAT repeat protein